MRSQPPIFSGVPERKRTLSQSYQPAEYAPLTPVGPTFSDKYLVFSRLTPGLNRIFLSGIVYLSFVAFSHLTQEQRNLGLSALDQPGENLAATLGPSPERIGCAIPVTPVCLHSDGAALEVA